MANYSDSPEMFISKVAQYLETKDYASAIDMFNDEQNHKFLKNNCWDIIPELCKHITKEKQLINNELASCCERLLEKVAKESNPNEALLELLGQMDEADPDKFKIVLKLIKIILLRETTQKTKSLEWTLNSIRSYMEVYSFDVNPVEYNENLEDFYSSEKLQEIEGVTNSVIEFYEHFVVEANSNPEEVELKQLLSSRLLQMFDVFLPYVQPEVYPDVKILKWKILNTLLQLISNPMTLLEYVFYRALNVMKPKSKANTSLNAVTEDYMSENLSSAMKNLDSIEILNPFEDDTVVSNLAYGMFFYCLLSETENEQAKVPLVYNPKYVMLSLIYVTIPFFDQKTDTVIRCGLKFLDFLLNQLNYCLTKSDLYFSTHKSVLMHLNNIMVFSQVEENRRLALVCFKKYIESFNWEARYLLLLNYRSHISHSGTVGFLIGLLKDYTTFFLEQTPASQTQRKFLKYYKGKFLFDLIKMYCYTSSDDLVENADHVISSLNALRFLVLRDKKNFTGVRNLSFVRHSSSKNQDSQDIHKEPEDQQYESQIREKILNASLQFVHKHGWSKNAISNGAESLGYPGITNGIFPNGGADLINHFYTQCNQKLKAHMIEVTSESEKPVEPKSFIQKSLETRLRLIIPYINSWPQAIAIMSLPPNAPTALANLLSLADDVCYYAGDKSVDFDWYTRRMGVGGIYKMSELFMLQDKSLDFTDTWKFLDRRLTEAFQIQKVLNGSSEAATVAKGVVASAFTTAKNILRLNVPR